MSENTRTNSMKQARISRPWPVTLLGLLLLAQAIGLLLLGAFKVIVPDDSNGGLFIDPADLIGVVFVLLACLALFTAFGFWRRWRNAWLNAMLLQGLCLMIALALYFRDRPPYVYGLMFYCVTMVLYLNHYEVQEAFRAKPLPQEEEWPL
jgi:hypothetical protein